MNQLQHFFLIFFLFLFSLEQKFYNFNYIGCVFVNYGHNQYSGTDGEIRCVTHSLFNRYESYLKGDPCSQCVTECDTTYTGLCKTQSASPPSNLSLRQKIKKHFSF